MTADEEEYAFFHELGRALLAWSQVEDAMRNIVMICGGGFSTGLAYTKIANFRSRLDFLESMLLSRATASRLPSDRQAKLLERLVSAAKLRNSLAHGQAIKFPNNASGKRIGLVASSMPNQDSIARALTIRLVVQIRLCFEALSVSLQNASFELLGQPDRFPECDELPPRPPTIRKIEDRMREAFGRQPRPSSSLPSQQVPSSVSPIGEP